jgi:tetratricopeptide (TPR) repeat protein
MLPKNLFYFFLLSGGLLFSLVNSCREKKDEKETKFSQNPLVANVFRTDPLSCRPCHAGIVDSFLKTGKGRSFYKADKNLIFENWKTKPVYDPKSDFYYLPFRSDSLFWVKEFRLEGRDTTHSRIEKIDFFIGSGNQTRSYLFQRNGYLFEIPITWYSKKKIWDLSPGYANGHNSRFDREVGSECMACHNAGFQEVPNSFNRYKHFGATLSCNNCHGDTRNHLEEMNRSGGKSKDIKLVSLGKSPVQARLDVCRQCHLEGIKVRKEKAKAGDYEPGKLFSDYYEVFIPASGKSDFGFASHAERLQMSQCFKVSDGKMNCNTCHDPHSSIPEENKAAFFNVKCRSCHENSSHMMACKGVKNKDLANANCISCHLKRSGTNDIPHVNSTDHWIRRKPAQSAADEQQELEFQHFAGKNFDPADKGKAILKYAEVYEDSSKLRQVKAFLNRLPQAEKLNYYYLSQDDWDKNLDTSGFSASGDPWILFRWADLKKKKGLPYLGELEKASALAPDRTEFQYRLALACEGSPKAEAQYRKVLILNLMHVKTLSNLAFHALESRQYAKADSLLVLALKSNPDFPLALENMARSKLEQGQFAPARQYLNRLIRLFPQDGRYQTILNTLP